MTLEADFALCAGSQVTFRETDMPRLRLITLQTMYASTFCTREPWSRQDHPTTASEGLSQCPRL